MGDGGGNSLLATIRLRQKPQLNIVNAMIPA